jgi:hypothetical protein
VYRAVYQVSSANLASVRFVADIVPFIAKYCAALGSISQLGWLFFAVTNASRVLLRAWRDRAQLFMRAGSALSEQPLA